MRIVWFARVIFCHSQFLLEARILEQFGILNITPMKQCVDLSFLLVTVFIYHFKRSAVIVPHIMWSTLLSESYFCLTC